MGSAGVPTAHRRGMGWRGGFLASALIQHAKLDMLKWLYLLRDLSLTPLTLTGTDISEVFSQSYTGTCTICPPARAIDFFRLTHDPDREKMARIILGGEQATFPKMSMIIPRMAIEKTLKECRKAVRLELQKK
jgi:hypothetical protein